MSMGLVFLSFLVCLIIAFKLGFIIGWQCCVLRLQKMVAKCKVRENGGAMG